MKQQLTHPAETRRTTLGSFCGPGAFLGSLQCSHPIFWGSCLWKQTATYLRLSKRQCMSLDLHVPGWSLKHSPEVNKYFCITLVWSILPHSQNVIWKKLYANSSSFSNCVSIHYEHILPPVFWKRQQRSSKKSLFNECRFIFASLTFDRLLNIFLFNIQHWTKYFLTVSNTSRFRVSKFFETDFTIKMNFKKNDLLVS